MASNCGKWLSFRLETLNGKSGTFALNEGRTLSGQSIKATRWKRNRKFGDIYGGRQNPKLAENIFARRHSRSRPSETNVLPILIEDNPSRDYFFLMSVEECWEAIQTLPTSDIEGLTHIWCRRVPTRKVQSAEHPFAEFVCGSGVRAFILYSWPKSLRMVHGAKKPDNSLINEFRKYGAEFVHQRGQWQSVWTLAGLRKFYLEGPILHEVGHHVDQYSRKWSKSNAKAVESFADDYAMQRTASTTHLFDNS